MVNTLLLKDFVFLFGRFKFVVILFSAISVASLEVLSLYLISIVLKLSTNQLQEFPVSLLSFMQYFSIDIFGFGIIVCLILCLSSSMALYLTYKLVHISTHFGVITSNSILRKFLYNVNNIDNSKNSFSKLLALLQNDSLKATTHVLIPFFHLIPRFFLVLGIATFLLFYNFVLFAAITLPIFCIYLFIFLSLRLKIRHSGTKSVSLNESRIKTAADAFDFADETRVYRKNKWLLNEFESTGEAYSNAQVTVFSLGQLPKYFIELVVFLVIVIYFSTNASEDVLISASVVGVGGLKLLPAMQNIYQYCTIIEGHIKCLERVLRYMDVGLEQGDLVCKRSIEYKRSKLPIDSIKFRNISLRVASSLGLNFTVKRGTLLGIVGPSGVGKSTLLRILAGLEPEATSNIKFSSSHGDTGIALQELGNVFDVAYVPSMVAVASCTVAENIAMSSIDLLDRDSIRRCLDRVGLENLGLDEVLSSEGRTLSTGERQRLGLARALYAKAELFLLDEVTSGLDLDTENSVLSVVRMLADENFVIMVAHRPAAKQACDEFFSINHGRYFNFYYNSESSQF